MRIPTWLALLVLAALHTAGNVAKPLHIDDTAYYYYARQTAQRPLDPYGFQVFWWHNPEPANEVLAPPLLPYWWSLALRIDGDHSWVWKLGMVPFSLLFIGSLYVLFRRFAGGLELPLVWLTVLSPTFWPSLNLMLDIPALALGLFSLTLFMSACDHNSFGRAALAGLVLGMAIQTKYTAFLMPIVMLVYAVSLGRIRLWPPAALVAAQVFVAWEGLMALLYGQSHFLYRYRLEAGDHWLAKLSQLLPLLGILGSIAPAILLLALRGLRVPRSFLLAAGLLCFLGYGLVANIKDTEQTQLPLSGVLFTNFPAARPNLPFQEAWFGAWGVAFAFLVAGGVALLLRLWPSRPRPFDQPATPLNSWPRMPNHRTFRIITFLVLWLCVEIAGYAALTPFPAVRRVMGIIVVCTLIAGCLAARTSRSREGNAAVWGIVAYGTVLGLGFSALDWREAQAEQEAVERAAAWIDENGDGGKVWFVGHWGFQFYAECAGMAPLSPGQSELQEGEYLVYPTVVHKQFVDLDAVPCELMQKFPIDDPVSLKTVMCYYSGNTAIENRDAPRVTIWIYRITKRCVPGDRN